MHSQRETLVLHPHPRMWSKLKFQGGFPSLYLAVRFSRRFCFCTMIADYAGHIHATQFPENIRSGAPGDNDTGV